MPEEKKPKLNKDGTPRKKGWKPKTWKKAKSKEVKEFWKDRKKKTKETNANVLKLADYVPWPKQAEMHRALDLGKKVVIAYTGIRYGKTHGGCVETYRQKEKPPKSGSKRANISWILAPTYPMLEGVIVPKMQELFHGAILDFKKSPYPRWYFPNPHAPMPYIVEGRTADNPDRLRGAEIDFCWCDEAAICSEEALDIVMGRLGTTKGQLLCTTTPNHMSRWFVEQYVNRATKGHPNYDSRYYIFRAKTEENPLMDKMTIDHLRSKYTKEFAAQELDAEDVVMTGLIYRSFDRNRHTFDPKEFVIKDTDEVIGGIDWGWDDPFVFLFIVKRGDKYYVLDEYFKQHWTVDEHCKFLNGHPLLKRVERAFADPSQPAARSQVREALGFPVNRGRTERKDLLAGINHVGSLIEHDKLYVSASCSELLKEFEAYQWVEKDDRNSGDRPMDACNHGMDALRYVCYSTRGQGGELRIPQRGEDIRIAQAYTKQNTRRKIRTVKRRPRVIPGKQRNSWLGDYKW